MREHAKIALSPSRTSSSSEYETTDEGEMALTRPRTATKKMKNALMKSEWSKKKPEIAITKRGQLFVSIVQDILRDKIKSCGDL